MSTPQEPTVLTMQSTSTPTTTATDSMTTTVTQISTTTLMTSVNPTSQMTISETPVESTSTGSDSMMNQTGATPESESTTAAGSTSTVSTVDRTTAMIEVDQSSTSESEIVSITPIIVTAVSTDGDNATSVVGETSDTAGIVMTNHGGSTTVAQSSGAPKFNITIIIGVIIGIFLLTISGIALFTIITIIAKKRGKSVGAYSFSNNSDSTLNIPNGVSKLSHLFDL